MNDFQKAAGILRENIRSMFQPDLLYPNNVKGCFRVNVEKTKLWEIYRDYFL